MAKPAKISKKKLAAMSTEQLSLMPGMKEYRMYDIRRNRLWKPDTKILVSGNPTSAKAWQDRLRSDGFLDEDELKEEQGRMFAIIRAAKGEGEYDPASVANKKSGYGTKPSHKPTRDYKVPPGVANNGNPTGVVRY